MLSRILKVICSFSHWYLDKRMVLIQLYISIGLTMVIRIQSLYWITVEVGSPKIRCCVSSSGSCSSMSISFNTLLLLSTSRVYNHIIILQFTYFNFPYRHHWAYIHIYMPSNRDFWSEMDQFYIYAQLYICPVIWIFGWGKKSKNFLNNINQSYLYFYTP